MTRALLEAIGIAKTYPAANGPFTAVDNVSLTVHRGETLGLVGESGCGKSTLGRSLLRLQTITEGTIRFDGLDITTLSMRALRPLRPRMQMVFQDPYASLNPRRRIGDLIAEPLRVHRTPDHKRRPEPEITNTLNNLIELVGLKREHLPRYPHEFSGGQRQRIGIARALALHPDLVIADEPVSALDVSVQAQIVNLLMDLQEKLALTYIFIAHDLAVIRQIATRTAVMYLGAIVESGPTAGLFANPAHPYTAALLAAVPKLSAATGPKTQAAIKGELPTTAATLNGCRFHPRCPRAESLCRNERPALMPIGDNRQVACHFPL